MGLQIWCQNSLSHRSSFFYLENVDTLIVVLVVAIMALWAYCAELRGSLKAEKANRDAALKHASRVDSENIALREEGRELRASARLVTAPAPPRPHFVPEEEAVPPDIAAALDRYPPELAEPTRLWITQQRRMRVDWEMIRRRVVGGTGGRLEDIRD